MFKPNLQESSGPQYPKLRVRSSWDFENRTLEPNLLSFDGLESVRSFDASQYSDGHSFSSDENYFQLPDLEKNLLVRNASSGLSVVSHDSVRNDSDQKTDQEQPDDNLGNRCKEVRCIESEDLITDTSTHSNSAGLSPNIDTASNASSPGENMAVSGLTEVDNIDKENVDLGSSGSMENKELNRFHQGFVPPATEKKCPWLAENSASSSRTLKLTRSRSCKASLMKDSSSDWFDQEEIIQNNPPTGIEKDHIVRPEGFQRKTYTLNSNANARLSWAGYGNSERSAAIDVQNVKSSTDKESDFDSDLSPVRRENKDFESSNLLANHQVYFYCSPPFLYLFLCVFLIGLILEC